MDNMKIGFVHTMTNDSESAMTPFGGQFLVPLVLAVVAAFCLAIYQFVKKEMNKANKSTQEYVQLEQINSNYQI